MQQLFLTFEFEILNGLIYNTNNVFSIRLYDIIGYKSEKLIF